VGWGQVSDFSEFNAAGQLLFDAHLPGHVESYRAFRFAWEATPAQPPDFVVQREASGARTVYASWNGATQVASWNMLAGATATSLQPVAHAAGAELTARFTVRPGPRYCGSAASWAGVRRETPRSRTRGSSRPRASCMPSAPCGVAAATANPSCWPPATGAR